MTSTNETAPPIVRLQYREGDLIVKEGNYGVSCYKVIKGKVSVFRESGGEEISLATLGPGSIFGEMVFLNRGKEARSESVRAIEDSEVEAWHLSRLSQEYTQMPPIIKYIADQILTRSLRMEKLLVQWATKELEKKENREKAKPLISQRRYYRKQVDLDCHYRPAGSSQKVHLVGRIKDISMGGIGLEIMAKNATDFSHSEGDVFVVNTVLPNDKNLEFEAKIMAVNKGEAPGTFLLGMSITEMSAGARKMLGFFLMP